MRGFSGENSGARVKDQGLRSAHSGARKAARIMHHAALARRRPIRQQRQ